MYKFIFLLLLIVPSLLQAEMNGATSIELNVLRHTSIVIAKVVAIDNYF